MIKERLAALETKFRKRTPCGMTVTLADGRQIVTDGGGAIDLLRAGESVVMVESNATDSGMLAGLLTALVAEDTDSPQREGV